jgi:hypothetical protein
MMQEFRCGGLIKWKGQVAQFESSYLFSVRTENSGVLEPLGRCVFI